MFEIFALSYGQLYTAGIAVKSISYLKLDLESSLETVTTNIALMLLSVTITRGARDRETCRVINKRKVFSRIINFTSATCPKGYLKFEAIDFGPSWELSTMN